MTGSGGRSGLLYGIAAAVCVVVGVVFAVRLVPQAGVGDVDPVSAVVALAALAVALLSARQAVRASRSTHPGAVEVAARLAIEVRRREGQARTQLLGGQRRTIDVDFDFRPAPAHDAQQPQPVGCLADVMAYYEALHPRRLVITGAPGAGKTVLAIELALGLLEVREPGDAVPVRVSAAAWNTKHPLDKWLVEHLIEAYRLPRPAAESLLDAGLVLPVIDGLDEMDADQTPGYTSRAGRAVQALNTYQHGRDAAPLVLTCRSSQYQALKAAQVWTHDAAHIEIRPVNAAKATHFIQSRVDDVTRWQPVLNTITNHPGGTLAVGLSTPWRLTLATTVYEQRIPETGGYLRDPAVLPKLGATSPDSVRDHLLEQFIPAAIAAHNAATEQPEPPYHDYQVHQWLRVLARYLDHNAETGRNLGGVPLSGTDLVLHELWPLAGVNRVRITGVATFALIYLVASTIVLTKDDIDFTGQFLIMSLGIGYFVLAAYLSWSDLWPMTEHFNIQKLRTKEGRRHLASGLAIGAASGLVAGFAVVLIIGLAVGDVSAAMLTFGLKYPLMSGVGLALTIGLTFRLTEDATAVSREPRDVVKYDLATGLAAGAVFGLACASGVGFGFAGPSWLALTLGFETGLTFALWHGLAGTRYVTLLLWTKRPFTAQPLPWQLGQFLDWCYQAGLIRQAGISYQFRHRELQHYLAHSQPQLAPTTIHQ